MCMKRTSQYLAVWGRIGGRARGKSKVRGDREYYRGLAFLRALKMKRRKAKL